MSGGGDHHDDDLGAFASERDEHAPAPVSRHALESPRLVPLVVALAVIGYGGLMVLWWERDKPDVKPSFSAAPTTSFRPSAPKPAPEPVAPAAPAQPRAAEQPGEVPDDFFVPAVARADTPARPAEAAAALPEPLPPPVPDAAEDVVPPPRVPAPARDVAPAAATPAGPPAADAVITAPARPVEPGADRIATDRVAIGDVLQSYRTAYNALDATSVSTIWQGLDTRALQRAFSTLSQQDVRFDQCDVRVTAADRAVASCRGVLSYVPRIGDGTPQQRRLSWNFVFQRAADRWLIASVSAR